MLNSSNINIMGRNIGEYYNTCLDHECQNGASCTPNTNGSYKCNCILGFSGGYCEEGSLKSILCYLIILSNFISMSFSGAKMSQ